VAFFNREKLTKAEFAWTMYDWANSVYATIIMASIFPIYFTSIAKEAGVAGDVMWGYGTSLATLFVVVLAPVLGSIADFSGMKKKLLIVSICVGCFFTLTMAIFNNWQLMLAGYIISYIGFALSCLFYDSFLTDVTTPERMNMVSAKGYAFGYLGGSTVPFIIAIVLLMLAPSLHISNTVVVKCCVVLTAFWWAAFSIPMILKVQQRHYIERPKSRIITAAFRNIGKTARDIAGNRSLLLFMIAYFLYIDGVGTVIHMATAYGTTIGLNSTQMILALMLTQLVAIPCSLGFARLAQRHGVRRTLLLGIGVYLLVCVVGFYMGFSLEQASGRADEALLVAGEAAARAIYEPAQLFSSILFWVLAVLVGTSQGGLQALSRSQFSRMIPPERSNEFFGFFDIFGKFATMVGPFIYATVASLSGRSSFGLLGISLLFILGIIVLMRTPASAFDRSYSDLHPGPPPGDVTAAAAESETEPESEAGFEDVQPAPTPTPTPAPAPTPTPAPGNAG
jgi:MFS transporter, UMF1 family